jgi:hypothetical protein
MSHPAIKESEIKEMIQVNQLIEEGKVKEAFQAIFELEQREDLSPKEQLLCRLVKADLFKRLGNYPEVIKCAKSIYAESQKRGDLLLSFDALIIQAYSYVKILNLIQGEDFFKQAQDLFKKIKETYTIDLRERESFLVRTGGIICFYKGEVQFSLDLTLEALNIAKDTGNKNLISSCLSNLSEMYLQLKDYDKAIFYAKKAVKIEDRYVLQHAVKNLIQIYLSKGDIKEAKSYLYYFRDHSEILDFGEHKNLYIYINALILKSSLRARDRIKSEDLFKNIALNTTNPSEERIDAIINLCDLYLTELRITNDSEIINEIQLLIQELLDIARNQDIKLVLAQTYLLQAKLSLLSYDIKKAKKFLTQAQDIAERYGLKRLAINLSNEHDKLLRQVNIWENLKESEVSLSERLKLAGLNEQMDYMMKKRMIEDPELTDEDPILLLIITEGGVPLFTHYFIEDKLFKDHLLGGFFTAINSFVIEMFSDGLDRASFGDKTLLMKSIPPFLLCYVYKGQSYSAQKRIRSFTDEIKGNTEVWDRFEKFYQVNRKIKLQDIPSLDLLIEKIFKKN